MELVHLVDVVASPSISYISYRKQNFINFAKKFAKFECCLLWDLRWFWARLQNLILEWIFLTVGQVFVYVSHWTDRNLLPLSPQTLMSDILSILNVTMLNKMSDSTLEPPGSSVMLWTTAISDTTYLYQLMLLQLRKILVCQNLYILFRVAGANQTPEIEFTTKNMLTCHWCHYKTLYRKNLHEHFKV